MKTLKIACTALILLAGAFAAACSSDTETEAADRVEIDGLDEGVHFPYDPEEGVSFSISANKTWSISKSGLDWLTVSQMNGGSKLPATITLTAAPNDDLERSGELTVYAGAHVHSRSTPTSHGRLFPKSSTGPRYRRSRANAKRGRRSP